MKQLADKVFDALGGRSAWEDKQRVFWDMRHEGLPRVNKPFPTAADLHFPLIDTHMRKLKPFWWQALSGQGNLTQFFATKRQSDELTTGASNFLDYVLRHETDWMDKSSIALTRMLLRGRGVIGAFVDPFRDHRLVIDVPDPMMVVVEQNATSLEEADWFVIVRHITKAAYTRHRRYNTDKSVMDRIVGHQSDSYDEWRQDKQDREGLTYSKQDTTIVIWEHWVKTMGGWMVHNYSPNAVDAPLRRPYGWPVRWKGKASFPWIDFPMELEDEGWYSPRGVAETLAPFESYACKLWNEKADSMTFSNRQMYTTTDGSMPNSNTIRFEHGEVLPGNLRQVKHEGPPISFDQEMASVRLMSEQLMMMPDFGVTDATGTKGEPRTATENQRIASLMDTATGYSVDILRRRLTKFYTHVWATLLQFAHRRQDWSYLAQDQWSQLTRDAVHDGYMIQPGGTSESWNRNANFQRAMAQFETLRGHPNANQEELARDVIAANDPAKVKTHFIPTNLKAATEAEDEAIEILGLMEGYPMVVHEHEDHLTRARLLFQKLMALQMEGRPVNPAGMQRLNEHLAVHIQHMAQINPDQAKAFGAEMQQAQQQMVMQQAQAAASQPEGVI